jgi:DNA-binding transcriptional MerR regulator
MSLLPLADCARLLGIHPKTLRQWLQQDAQPLSAHPRDARIKCLTAQQVEQLALAHDRSFQLPSEQASIQPDALMKLQASEEVRTALPILQEDASVSQKLSVLETRIAQLSEQVAHLTLALLQEQERTVERRLADLETVMQRLAGIPNISPPPPTQIEVERGVAHPPTRPLIEVELRTRSRMPPLIEYSVQGTYVVVSSLDGELSLLPDSREWFDWLATLSSFRFVGQSGRFTAYRESNHGKPTRGWVAHRCIHNRHFKHWLAVTDRLTVDRLEQMATRLQAHVDAL